jgi:hypothetical protein
MAKLKEEIIVIKVSKLLKDSVTESSPILPQASIDSLEAVIQELAGENVLVEIAKE